MGGRRRHANDSDNDTSVAMSAPGVVPNVVSKKRGLGGFDSATTSSGKLPAESMTVSSDDRPKQVAARGNWAQFVTARGTSYFHNVVTGHTTWEKPECGSGASRKAGENCETSLFVFHLPHHWTEDDLFTQFKRFGQVVRSSVQRGSDEQVPG